MVLFTLSISLFAILLTLLAVYVMETRTLNEVDISQVHLSLFIITSSLTNTKITALEMCFMLYCPGQQGHYVIFILVY